MICDVCGHEFKDTIEELEEGTYIDTVCFSCIKKGYFRQPVLIKVNLRKSKDWEGATKHESD